MARQGLMDLTHIMMDLTALMGLQGLMAHHHRTLMVLDHAWGRMETHACHLQGGCLLEALLPLGACFLLAQGMDHLVWGRQGLEWVHPGLGDHQGHTWDLMVQWDPHLVMEGHRVHGIWFPLEGWVCTDHRLDQVRMAHLVPEVPQD